MPVEALQPVCVRVRVKPLRVKLAVFSGWRGHLSSGQRPHDVLVAATGLLELTRPGRVHPRIVPGPGGQVAAHRLQGPAVH